MKVLHVSTASSGGSWTSASQLVKLQREIGIDSKLITLQDLQSKTGGLRKLFLITRRRTNTLFSKLLAKKQYEFISLYSVSGGLVAFIKSENPDVIHIHNWFNFLSYKDIAKIGQKYPVVFTMHDSRLATGGCHIPYNCSNFMSECKKCPAIRIVPQQVSRAKHKMQKSLGSVKVYAIIAPSNWMLSQAITSGVSKKSIATKKIYNIAPSCLALPQEIPKLKKIKLLFIAANLESRTKGLHILLESIENSLAQKIGIDLHLVGSGDIKVGDMNNGKLTLIKHGVLSSSETQNIMRNVDLLVVPSTSENFPNVILEAFAMGVIVVATDVGGISEMITHKTNGYLFNGSSSHLSEVIEFALKDLPNWQNVRISAQNKLRKDFNNEKSVLQTSEVYLDVINTFSEKTFK